VYVILHNDAIAGGAHPRGDRPPALVRGVRAAGSPSADDP
jgi:hypothetical protein